MNIYGEYFFGNKISEYGLENGYLDYGTFAAAFAHVLNNDVMSVTENAGFYWEQVAGFVDNSEAIEEVESDIEELRGDIRNYKADADDAYESGDNDRGQELEDCAARAADQIEELRERLEELEQEQEREPGEVFQWYIVPGSALEILEENNEVVFYCESLDMYLWGVCHWGTAWDYVLTDIRCNTGKF